jgi:tetratricopeptide (TPR) repeat protein
MRRSLPRRIVAGLAWRPACAPPAVLALTLVFALGLGPAALPAATPQGGDREAQILYAFHTEDRHALSGLIQSLRTQLAAGDDDALRYHLAHADYRMGRLVGGPEADAAWSDCIDQLKVVLRHEARSAEAMVLQSVCYALLANDRSLEAVLLRRRAAERLAAAHELAPRNPRVNMFMALDGLEHAPRGSPQSEAAFARLQLTARLFEESSATADDAPGWGHAEAYLALGRELLTRGDFLGARNWIEKSLLAAPDFKSAQLQLAAIERR